MKDIITDAKHREKYNQIKTVFVPFLCVLLSCSIGLLLFTQLSYIDVCITCVGMVSCLAMLVCLYKQNVSVMQALHFIFGIQLFVIVPLFAESTYLVGLHLCVLIATMGLRAEFKACVFRVLEGKSKTKPYDHPAIDAINFNLLFTLLGVVYVVKLIRKNK